MSSAKVFHLIGFALLKSEERRDYIRVGEFAKNAARCTHTFRLSIFMIRITHNSYCDSDRIRK